MRSKEFLPGSVGSVNFRAKISYDRGGWIMWSGIPARRGCYLMLYPVRRSPGRVAHFGIRKLIKEAERFSESDMKSFTMEKVVPIVRACAVELNYSKKEVV
jgi:hypothetical protein